MNTILNRHKVAIPAQRSRPAYWTDEAGGRTDLRCTVCGKVIAYAVEPSRVAADAPFFVEAHTPFCMGRS